MTPTPRSQILTWAAIAVVFLGYPLLVAGLTGYVEVARSTDREAWTALATLGAAALEDVDDQPFEAACAGRLELGPPEALITWSAPTALEGRVGRNDDGFSPTIRPPGDVFAGYRHGRWETARADDDYYPQGGGLYWKLLFEPFEWSDAIGMSTRREVDREVARWLVAGRVVEMSAPYLLDAATYDAGHARIEAVVLRLPGGEAVCGGVIDTTAPDTVVARSWGPIPANGPDALGAAFERRMRDAPAVAVCDQVSAELCTVAMGAGW